MNVEDIIDEICKVQNDENGLRKIRDIADSCLQHEKEMKAMQQKDILEKKYKGKYLLIYGHYITMMSTQENHNDMKIVYVEDISFQGNNFFRCKAKGIHIKYNDEYNEIAHLTSNDYGSCYISYFDDDQFSLNENDISKIIDKVEVDKILSKAKQDFNTIVDSWEL